MLFLGIAIFGIELIHFSNVDEDQNHESDNRPLLGKPESDWETSHTKLIKEVDKDDSSPVGHQEPNT